MKPYPQDFLDLVTEVVQNAGKVKGPKFSNLVSSMFEYDQICESMMMLRDLASKNDQARAEAAFEMTIDLVESIIEKLGADLSQDDINEAERLADLITNKRRTVALKLASEN